MTLDGYGVRLPYDNLKLAFPRDIMMSYTYMLIIILHDTCHHMRALYCSTSSALGGARVARGDSRISSGDFPNLFYVPRSSGVAHSPNFVICHIHHYLGLVWTKLHGSWKDHCGYGRAVSNMTRSNWFISVDLARRFLAGTDNWKRHNSRPRDDSRIQTLRIQNIRKLCLTNK